LFSLIVIDSFPNANSILVFLSVSPLIFDATAVAHAAVPHAFVSPAPLSQTLTFINVLLITFARVTLHFSGK